MDKLFNLEREWERGKRLGLCQGDRQDYRPWINIRTFHSKTTRYRMPSLKLGRCLHLMSYGELCCYLQLDWDDTARDIKEQYALDPRLTREVCESLNYLHPGYSDHGHVMTSDFLVSRWTDKGTLRLTAIQVKHGREDLDKRTLEKIEIEKAYWEQRKGYGFQLMLTDEQNPVLCGNLQRLYGYRQQAFSQAELRFLMQEVSSLRIPPGLPFSCFPRKKLPPLPSGHAYSALDAVKILCAHKALAFPIGKIELAKACWQDFAKGPAYV